MKFVRDLFRFFRDWDIFRLSLFEVSWDFYCKAKTFLIAFVCIDSPDNGTRSLFEIGISGNRFHLNILFFHIF